MKKNQCKQVLVTFCCLATIFGSGSVASAQDISDLIPGVTVTEDTDSPTGYTATFVYENADAETVNLAGSFSFYYDEKDIRGEVPETSYSPYEWNDGMFEVGDESYTEEMKKVENTDYWTLSMPLPSGHYQYAFYVDGSEESVDDPANPAIVNTAVGGHAFNHSTFEVPYNSEKYSESVDYSFTMPREDGQKGELTFTNYTDLYGETSPLAIYLPAGYDPDREEPYKVLYLCHGGGGNELEWLAGGNAGQTFDNLTAEGLVEPTILVATYEMPYMDGLSVTDDLLSNLIDHVLPFIEENYNVSSDANDRAYAGMSMGGMVTSHVLHDCSDKFRYFGVISAANTDLDFTDTDITKENAPTIFLGAGIYDFGLVKTEDSGLDLTITTFKSNLDKAEIPYACAEALGSHDRSTGMQMLKVFAEKYLWK